MAVQAKITADEFLQLPETNVLTELIDGEIIVAPAPKASHQETVFTSAKAIEQIAPHGKVHISPIDVYLDNANVVQPDVMWNGADSQSILIDDAYWRGAPDLIVEVLSPSTALRDKGVKFRLYERYGVGEYWLVEPAARYVEVWHRSGEQFVLHGVFGTGETFTSSALGDKAIEVSGIFGITRE